jgi:hypothetical protein
MKAFLKIPAQDARAAVIELAERLAGKRDQTTISRR